MCAYRVEDTPGANGVDGETTANGTVKVGPEDDLLLTKVSTICHI